MKLSVQGLAGLQRKIKNLPRKMDESIQTGTKYHADGFIKVLWNGLRTNSLVSPKLKQSTISIKTKQGKPYIHTPLVGMGDHDKKSMVNGLRPKKTKTGIKIVPQGKHYSGVDQKLIWNVHENGATIKNGFGKGIIIKIPARHPLREALRKYLGSKEKTEANKKVKKEILRIIKETK